MEQRDYTIAHTDIDALAQQVSQALGLRLYRVLSPLSGYWYTESDPALWRDSLAKGVSPPQLAWGITLSANDNPYGPGSDERLLEIRGAAALLDEWEARLAAVGLKLVPSPGRKVSPR